MNKIEFSCPTCHCEVESSLKYGGEVSECPNCGQLIMIPMPGIHADMSLGGFVIIKKLATGGMGEVWLARQKSMDRLVALKILPPALTNNRDFIESFYQETRILARLSHPNIVTAHDAGLEDGIYYLATSFIDGEDLEERIRRKGKLTEFEALTITEKVAEALKYAWKKYQIIHRDIKPGNIMLTRDGEVRLMDMGISRCITEHDFFSRSRYVYGTPTYMSPEQARNKPLDCRTDIYSLGITLYQGLTGKVPFKGTTIGEVSRMQKQNRFSPLRKLNHNISRECALMIHKMMAYNTEKRYQNWDELIDDTQKIRAIYDPETESTMSTISYAVILFLLIFICAILFAVDHFSTKLKDQVAHPNTDQLVSSPLDDLDIDGSEKGIASNRQILRDILKKKPSTASEFALTISELETFVSGLEAGNLKKFAKKELEILKYRRVMEVNKVLEKLNERSRQYELSKNYKKVISIYNNYTGPWADETNQARLAKVHRFQQLLDSRASKTKLILSDIFDDLLLGDFTSAKAQFTSNELSSLLSPLETTTLSHLLNDLTKLDNHLNSKLKELKNQTLEIKINDEVVTAVTGSPKNGLIKVALSNGELKEISLHNLESKLNLEQLTTKLKYSKGLFRCLKLNTTAHTVEKLMMCQPLSKQLIQHYLAQKALMRLLESHKIIDGLPSDKATFLKHLTTAPISGNKLRELIPALFSYLNNYQDCSSYKVLDAINKNIYRTLPWEKLFKGKVTSFNIKECSLTLYYSLEKVGELEDFEKVGDVAMTWEKGISIDGTDSASTLLHKAHFKEIKANYSYNFSEGGIKQFLKTDHDSLLMTCPGENNPESSLSYFQYNFQNEKSPKNFLSSCKLKSETTYDFELNYQNFKTELSVLSTKWPSLPLSSKYVQLGIKQDKGKGNLTSLNISGKVFPEWFFGKLKSL